MKTFILGDVHGAHKALLQVLSKSNFDYENDTLISLGDICDGWSEVVESFEELFKIKHLIFVKGNHDLWFLDFCENSLGPDGIRSWKDHGGLATIASYQKHPDKLTSHLSFIKKSKDYYVDDKNRAFVHAGIPNRLEPLNRQIDYCWDRTFYQNAPTWHHQGFEVKIPVDHLNHLNLVQEWFVGHTPVSNFKNHKKDVPVKYSNITFVDTGAAFDGVLTLMDLNSGEIFQSEVVRKLYPDEKGRNKNSYNGELTEMNKLW